MVPRLPLRLRLQPVRQRVLRPKPQQKLRRQESAAGAATAGNDLLADILARGVLRISTDPAYPPQSELVTDAQLSPDSKCSGDERQAGEFTGFDIDTAVEIAKRLGVEALLCHA